MKINNFRKWPSKDIIILLEKLEMYTSSGLAINKALEVSSGGANKRQKKSLDMVLSSVSGGVPLFQALSEFVGISPTVSGLIAHGESSGRLRGALGMAKSLMDREDELFKKCTSAMVYPAAIGFFTCLLTFGLVRGVMPQIIPMLNSLNVELPFLTRTVIFISELLLKYGLYASLVLTAVASLFIFGYRRYMKLKFMAQSVILGIPLLGPIVHSYHLAIFLHSCGSLLESGSTIETAYVDTVGTVAFLPLRARLKEKIAQIGRGRPVGSAFNGRHFPLYVASLVDAGEISGSLGSSMRRAASIVDREIEQSIKRLTALIEPLMMAGMGTIVGSVALSIMMPIYDISKVLQR